MLIGIGFSNPLLVGVIGIVLMPICVVIGIRVVFAASLIGLLGLVELIGWGPAAGIVGIVPHAKASTYALSVLPMFIFIGFVAFHAGMTEQLFDAARKWLGWLPGGLAVATIFATPKLAAGVVAAGGTLATLIPPSAILVIYAIIVEESVGRLLLAGFLPGLVSAIVYAGIIIAWAKYRPLEAPAISGFTWKERMTSLPPLVPIFAVVIIIISSVYEGWATPTEAGALGAGVVFIAAMIRGTSLKAIQGSLMETAKLTVMIFSLIWGVTIFVRFLGFSGVAEAFTLWIVSIDAPPLAIMICILLSYAILGMFMDAIGMLLLTLPVVYPAVMALGYDSIWFGIIVVKMAAICLVTPPIGLNCFVVNAVRPDIPLSDVFRGIAIFVVADAITIIVLLIFPEIVTWLPNLMRG
jgi:tripartite ATP-independent transporter DctM subunit